MRDLRREEQLGLALEAGRAPSAHNAQPARWRFMTGGDVMLYEDVQTRLPVADPTGKDASVSLGVAFEAMCLALSRRGLGLSEPRVFEHEEAQALSGSSPRRRTGSGGASDQRYVPVAEASLIPIASVDPLAVVVGERRTFRGRFDAVPAESMTRLRSIVDESQDLVGVFASDAISELAKLNDASSFSYLRIPAYQRELYGWMRFTARDPRWNRDGLNADCLGMSAPERLAAAVLFRPGWFGVLKAIGLARPLTSEGSATRSASAIVAVHRPAGERWFAGGRRLFRFWLELEQLGLSACLMSALADDPEAAARLARRCGIPPNRQIVNVFRIGIRGRGPDATSPRLPADELVL